MKEVLIELGLKDEPVEEPRLAPVKGNDAPTESTAEASRITKEEKKQDEGTMDQAERLAREAKKLVKDTPVMNFTGESPESPPSTTEKKW